MENLNKSFVSVLKRGSHSHVTPEITKPALVLDETCIKEFNFGMSLMGRVKDVSAIPKLPCIISKEGFQNVKLSYLGGMWVLFEFDSLASKEKFINHFELDAWFPNFQEDDQDDLSSNGESQEGDVANKVDNNESDVDRVSKSSFMHENDTAHKDVNSCKKREVGSHSEGPFNIYEQVSTCDYFVTLMGTWALNSFKLLIISVYAPQELNERRELWDTFIDWWEGDTVIMGDFNEVRLEHERVGSTFNRQGAIAFNNFISLACLIDLLLEGYAFTWAHKKINIQQNLSEVDKLIDQGKSNDEILIKRITLLNDLQELNNRNAMKISQKAKIRWSIEGDENSKYFHGIMNKKRSQLTNCETLANEEWISKPHRVKNEFFTHSKKQFSPIQAPGICFDFTFLTRLSSDQVQDIERTVTYEEAKRAVWDCGTNKSPSQMDFPLNFTIRIGQQLMMTRLCVVLPYLISDVQSDFIANHQILDGPFILNELLSWCKFKNLNGMIFKIDFEKAFDSVKWDYLDETLKAFGFWLKMA
uniref:RNA-directed DNA polymerase, eukaryota n=1 Tax=Tanacetum cinerariifolium TaxID=118510 RepID=A0A6L2LMS8_TANCI|nr:RNA-directed DNA polymerase, eukaryota [Tanacetum cinerariifolium]